MNTIEQARNVAECLRALTRNRNDGSAYLIAADTIDALIAELNDERMRCAQADNAVAQMAAELAALKAQKPVAWALPEITQQHNGQIVKHTAFHGYSVKLYLAAGAQPYDQQAMEPCEACGWKAIIPGERCLVCERNDALAAGEQPSDAIDAARYRWLRDPCSDLSNCYYSRGDFGRGLKNTTMLDEVIDAAKEDGK